MKKILFILLACAIIIPNVANAQTLAEKYQGCFLLQVQDKGRVWYVSPADNKKYEVTFDKAMSLFEKMATGITNSNLKKLPINPKYMSSVKDSDNDGYSDKFEVEQNYDPYGPGKPAFDHNLVKKMMGKLLMAVEDKGRIWYVDFDGLRTEITWANMIDVFIAKAHGFSNADLNKITTGPALNLKLPNVPFLNCDEHVTCLIESAKRKMNAQSRFTVQNNIKFQPLVSEKPIITHDIHIKLINEPNNVYRMYYHYFDHTIAFTNDDLASFYSLYRGWDFSDDEIHNIIYGSPEYSYPALYADYYDEYKNSDLSCNISQNEILNLLGLLNKSDFDAFYLRINELTSLGYCGGVFNQEFNDAMNLRNDERYYDMYTMKSLLSLMCVDNVGMLSPAKPGYVNHLLELPYADNYPIQIHRYIDFDYIHDPRNYGVCDKMNEPCEYTAVLNDQNKWNPCDYAILFSVETAPDTYQTKCLTEYGISDIYEINQCK